MVGGSLCVVGGRLESKVEEWYIVERKAGGEEILIWWSGLHSVGQSGQEIDVSYQLSLTRTILCFCPSCIGDALANLADFLLLLKT